MRVARVATRLPDPEELAGSGASTEPAEQLRLAPITPAPQRRSLSPLHAGAPVIDPRALASLDASIDRLADLDGALRDLPADVRAAIGARLEAVRALAVVVREVIADRGAIERARRALIAA